MADKKPPIFKDPVKLNIPTAEEVNKGALVPFDQSEIQKNKRGLKSLLRKAHPLVRAIDTISVLNELVEPQSSYVSDTLTPSEEKFKGITERIAEENMDLVNKVLEIILPDPRHEMDWEEGTGKYVDDEGLRRFAKEQIKKAPNPKGLRTVVDKRGLPRLIYHATHSPEPFKDFHTESRWGDKDKSTEGFLSTGTDRREMQRWHRGKEGGFRKVIGHEPDEEGYYDKPVYGEMAEGSRTLPGIVRAKNIFDHRNPEHLKMLRDSLIEDQVNVLKYYLDAKGTQSVNIEELREQYRGKDGIIRASEEAIQEHLDSNIDMRNRGIEEARHRIEKLKEPRSMRYIEKGDWQEIEREKNRLKELGFDAFTTRESGQNIMLTDPAEQFVPLFDPEKKNPMGYTHGGKI